MPECFTSPGPYGKQTCPAPGLRDITRNITTHNEKGKGVFLPPTNSQWDSPMANGWAINNVIYNTTGFPVDLNDGQDFSTLIRIIDFAPGCESNAHRALSLGYGVVLEREFEFELDSGEKRVMKRGDVSVNRATIHTWRNLSPTEPARMLYVLLPIKPLYLDGKLVEQDMGRLAESYPADERK
ncbi:cupin domain-containing protein [Aspergillus fijiensis CBS 313.89]|uniref:Cupin domain-containing protein n=1 Tax=Aspergillus fijiensis CBS 313.89 TaxID=1448319 RepID=A0A8G1RLM8_9EURO|nr:cupin domain-containing protein [Aspergillus fijiensis CBS 313.89]RAK75029.1 cupin domain-containing protein [Aspergillus fijiensis CBS 313.89]